MKKWILMLSLSFSPNLFAMFCPSNLNIINLGDTIDQVIAQCGAPDSQRTYTATPNLPQEWSYYAKARATDRVNTKMTVLFRDNKILNISITGPKRNKLLCDSAQASNDLQAIQLACGGNSQEQYNVTSTNLCGASIQVGDPSQKVETLCGKPDFVSQSQPQQQQPPVEITEFKYTTPTQVTLIFENGRLQSRTR